MLGIYYILIFFPSWNINENIFEIPSNDGGHLKPIGVSNVQRNVCLYMWHVQGNHPRSYVYTRSGPVSFDYLMLEYFVIV